MHHCSKAPFFLVNQFKNHWSRFHDRVESVKKEERIRGNREVPLLSGANIDSLRRFILKKFQFCTGKRCVPVVLLPGFRNLFVTFRDRTVNMDDDIVIILFTADFNPAKSRFHSYHLERIKTDKGNSR